MEESDSSQQPKRCSCGFWGSSQTSGLCSKCYKATVQENTQDGLDAKAELMRDRQSAYSSHESCGAASTSFLPPNRSQPASQMEKAEEFLRQAVKNSNNTNNNVTQTTHDNLDTIKSIEDTSDNNKRVGVDEKQLAPSTSTTQSADSTDINNLEKTSTNVLTASDSSITDKCDSGSNVNATDSVNKDKADLNVNLGTPEKRGIKRDSSVVDDSTPESTPEKPGTKSKKRCSVCKCRLELAQRTIGKCRCGSVFCSLHRLPELHQCDFDHKEDGRREAREKMVKPTRHLGNTFKRLDSDS